MSQGRSSNRIAAKKVPISSSSTQRKQGYGHSSNSQSHPHLSSIVGGGKENCINDARSTLELLEENFSGAGSSNAKLASHDTVADDIYSNKRTNICIGTPPESEKSSNRARLHSPRVDKAPTSIFAACGLHDIDTSILPSAESIPALMSSNSPHALSNSGLSSDKTDDAPNLTDLVAGAPMEDIDHLYRSLTRQSSTFGMIPTVSLSKRWEPSRRSRFQFWGFELGLVSGIGGRLQVPPIDSTEFCDALCVLLKERLDALDVKPVEATKEVSPVSRTRSLDAPTSLKMATSTAVRSTSVGSVSSCGSSEDPLSTSSGSGNRRRCLRRNSRVSTSHDSALSSNLTPMRRSSSSVDDTSILLEELNEVEVPIMQACPDSFARRVRSRTASTDFDSPQSARDRFASLRSDSGDDSNQSSNPLFLDPPQLESNGSYDEDGYPAKVPITRAESFSGVLSNKLGGMHLFSSRRPGGARSPTLSSDSVEAVVEEPVLNIAPSLNVSSRLDFVRESTTRGFETSDDEEGDDCTQSTIAAEDNDREDPDEADFKSCKDEDEAVAELEDGAGSDLEGHNTSNTSSDCGFLRRRGARDSDGFARLSMGSLQDGQIQDFSFGNDVVPESRNLDTGSILRSNNRQSYETGAVDMSDMMTGFHSNTKSERYRPLFRGTETPIRDGDSLSHVSPEGTWSSGVSGMHRAPPRSGNSHRKPRGESWGSSAPLLSGAMPCSGCPTPITGSLALHATPQQTPQATAVGWGSRQEMGDWGSSCGAEKNILSVLMSRLKIAHKSMMDSRQLSPSVAAGDASLFQAQCVVPDLPIMQNISDEHSPQSSLASPVPASLMSRGSRMRSHPSPLMAMEDIDCADNTEQSVLMKTARKHKRQEKSKNKLRRVSMGKNKALDMSRSIHITSPVTSPKASSPHANSFEAVVIGGTYAEYQEKGCPVIDQACMDDPRVIQATLNRAGQVKLSVEYPRKTMTKTLSKNSLAVRARNGMLISTKALNVKGAVAYYIPQDLAGYATLASALLPDMMTVSSPGPRISNRDSSLTPGLESMRIFSPIRSAEEESSDPSMDEASDHHSEHPSYVSRSKPCFTAPTTLTVRLAMEEDEDIADVLPATVVAHLLSFLNVSELFSGPVAASRFWSRQTVCVHAGLVAKASVTIDEVKKPKLARMRSMRAPGDLMSTASKGGAVPIKSISMISTHMPWGSYLSDGAFKKVYKVLNAKVDPTITGKWTQEAVSVMNVQDIMDTGAGSVVEQEIKVSLLVSSLVRRNECPNFVQTYGVFGADYPPPDALWGCDSDRHPHGKTVPRFDMGQDYHQALKSLTQGKPKPKSDPKSKGRHQFIRMELCTHGDIEEFIHVQPSEEASDECLRPMAFQMALSLHAAQRDFSMRHYDVKLLNFLLKEMDSSDSAVMSGDDPVRVCYGVNGQAFVLTFPSRESRLWVKLSDFGTADVDTSTIGCPIGLEQFTTLENSPIEQILLGTGSSQVYAADTWGLGLSILHLFTGHCPYEELLKDIACPDELASALKLVWEANDEVYEVVLEAAGEDEDGLMDRTLVDTLYRYLVLFGLPDDQSFEKCEAWHGNPVWRAVMSLLTTADLPVQLKDSRSSRKPNKDVRKRLESSFLQHRAMWSIDCGQEMIMLKARNRLESFNAMGILKRMMCYDASARPCMLDVINSELFAPLVAPLQDKTCYDYQFLKFM